jgi:hypothetical protein
MISRALCTLLTLLLLPALEAQSRVSKQGAHRMEVTLERLEEGAWKIIDPGLVLAKNDHVRFRFKSNFTGYLYVTNQSTSAASTLLFPRQDTGAGNRIVANREYMIPATSGAFRVDGPEGFDVISWLVSPVELGRPAAPAPPPAPQGRLLPRCDDTIFRARGACVDTSAGAQAGSNDDKPGGILVIRDKESSVIASTVPLKRPIVYEFHLAHR